MQLSAAERAAALEEVARQLETRADGLAEADARETGVVISLTGKFGKITRYAITKPASYSHNQIGL